MCRGSSSASSGFAAMPCTPARTSRPSISSWPSPTPAPRRPPSGPRPRRWAGRSTKTTARMTTRDESHAARGRIDAGEGTPVPPDPRTTIATPEEGDPMMPIKSITTALALAAFALPAVRGAELRWKQHTINGKSEFEAAGVLDADGDGKLDIVSGDPWYRAPDWTPAHVRDVTRQGTYYNCFATLPMDVNADGKPDYV